MWNVPVAANLATADLMISSPLLADGYQPARPATPLPREAAASAS